MQRLVITLLLTLAALGVLFSLTQLGDRDEPTPPVTPAETEEQTPADEDDAPAPAVETDDGDSAPPPPPEEQAEEPASFDPIPGLAVQPVPAGQPDPSLGSTEPDEETNPYLLEAQFTPFGAGVRHLYLSRFSTDVDEHQPYPIQDRLPLYDPQTGQRLDSYRYPLAAHSITVNGERVYLYHHRWEAAEITDEAVTFRLNLVDEDDEPVLRISRTWHVEPDTYEVRLEQRFENRGDQPLRLNFTQFGPVDMHREPGYIGDQRHIVIGYLQPRRADPRLKDPSTDDFYLSRRNILGREDDVIWPPPADQYETERDLLWAAMTNRYFAAALYRPVGEVDGRPARRPLEPQFPTVRRDTWGPADDPSLALLLDSSPFEIDPASAGTLRTNLYAGPKEPGVLKKEDSAYVALQLGDLIRYNLGGPCAALTFAWLAEGLLSFLTFIHDIFFDWGLAIILLVAVVRLLLHPLTKRSQVNMMKMGKQMQALQPEIDRLKKKYGDDQKKLQQEMLKLYQEKGVNPFAMGLGCLPMFVQMPIWIALYAMLYFAIELRHSPAFWGVFQQISGGSWPFLADLSAPDRFIPLPDIPLFFGFTLSGINLLPLLMMVVFYFQQKYMAPPPNPNMTDEQKMQQKMMRYMVMIFPVILYLAPSGLTLYILASTSVGIFESMRVRKHLQELEEQGKLFEPKKKKKEGGLWDRLQKAAEQQQKLMEQKQADREHAPGKGKGKGKKKNR